MTTAIVTGTSSGIGLHTAVQLASAGVSVIATVRDTSRAGALRAAADAAGVSLEVRTLDVTDAPGAAAFVEAAGPVDVLVNNAGRGAVGTLEQLSDADLQAQLPGMRTRGRGRVVTVTSVGGAVGQPFADAYCAAKFAVEGLMQSLAPVAAPFGVQVSVVEPAAVASHFVDSVDHSHAGPYEEQLQAYLTRSGAAFAAAQTPEDAARTVVEAALTDAPRFRWQTSEAAVRFAGLSLADLDGSRVLGATSAWVRPQQG